MTIVLIALAVVALAVAAGVPERLYATLQRPSTTFLDEQIASAVAQLSRPSVVVTTKNPDDRTFTGVLVAAHRDVIVLDHAQILTVHPNGETIQREALIGELVLERDHVAYLQLDPTPRTPAP